MIVVPATVHVTIQCRIEWQKFVKGSANISFVRAYGEAGNGNETETGNGNWKRKPETENRNGNPTSSLP